MYKTQRRPEKEMIFGIHAVVESVRSGRAIEKILLRRDMSNAAVRELFAAANAELVPVIKVPLEKLNQLTQGNHQGAIAFISPVDFQRIEDIVPSVFEAGRSPFVVVLDGVTDVRNFGAIARTAECAGVDALVVAAAGSAAANADAVKTSAGALLKIPVCRVQNLKNTLRYLTESGLTLVAVTEKAETDYTAHNYTAPLALVLGAEDEGISPEILKICAAQAAIPLKGTIQSLNVSVAGGVAMYEVVRQRNQL